jgi:hypothetical protein
VTGLAEILLPREKEQTWHTNFNPGWGVADFSVRRAWRRYR